MILLRRLVLVLVASFLLTLNFAACDQSGGTSDDADEADAAGDPPADIDDPSGDDDDDAGESGDETGAGPDDPSAEQPIGENPALGYGPYEVKIRFIELNDPQVYRSAYFFVPQVDGKAEGAPFPTIVWGHGIYSAYLPAGQMEMFKRMASKGYLVVYPNVEVPFPFPAEDTVTKGIITYLRAARTAVQMGLADREQMIFGGYSMGARIAALATAKTTGLDPLHQWPNPIACVYEALADYEEDGSTPIDIPGPRPSEWAPYIDPSIPQTIIVGDRDFTVRNYNPETGDPENGVFFYEQLPSDFAQLIILKSGTTILDQATHITFMAPNPALTDDLDLWGHMKVVLGLAKYHFKGGSRHWAYGIMRAVGGRDHAGEPMFHEVYERHFGQDVAPPDDNAEVTEPADTAF